MDLRLSKSIRRIIQLDTSPAGRCRVVTLFKRRRKRKKSSFGLRGLEKLVRKSGEAEQTFMDTYLERHNRSNSKKRDGWVRDLNRNVYKAMSKRNKKLRPSRLL